MLPFATNPPPQKPKKKKVAPPVKGIVNFYELPKIRALSTKTINPYYHQHGLKVPFRMIILGSTGSGKTNALMNLIHQCQNTFHKIIIITAAEEQFYTHLQNEFTSDLVTVKYSLDYMRTFNESHFFGQTLCIFDDQINVKDQRCIEELFIRGRKKNVSLVYLSQSFFKISKIIRLQTQYVLIVKSSSDRDLKLVMSDYSLGTTKEQMVAMYDRICNQNVFGDFLMIDLNAPQSRTFRHNFDKIIRFLPGSDSMVEEEAVF